MPKIILAVNVTASEVTTLWRYNVCIIVNVNQCQCQSWIYIAHKRKASNALVR